MKTERVYLLLGGNEGNRLQILWEAAAILEEKLADGAVRRSRFYETAAWGKEDQPSFLNLALAFDTQSSAEEILKITQSVENYFGRQRTELWGQRTLDIDILFFGNNCFETKGLTIPHPGIAQRKFALIPIVEIAPDFVHPVLGETMEALLATCKDELEVKIFE